MLIVRLFALLGLAHFAACVSRVSRSSTGSLTTEKLALDTFPYPQDRINEIVPIRKNQLKYPKPTWYKTIKWEGDESPTYEEVLKIAEKAWNWAVIQPDSRNDQGHLVVCPHMFPPRL